jgi:general nucleoside transport system permease protein
MTLRLVVEPRRRATPGLVVLVSFGSVALALALGAVFLTLTGHDPSVVYSRMIRVSFGSARGISETLLSATPLVLTGVAAAVAFRMLVWNIGGEGQLYVGAIFAAGVGIALGTAPPAVALPAVLVAGAIGGAAYAGVAALPRVTLGTNEIITTLMLNFVALHLMNYLVFGSFSPWRDPLSTNFPQGRSLSVSASLPHLWRRVDLGLVIAVVVAGLVWWALRSTRWGFEVRVAGDSAGAARYAGIPVTRKILGVFLLSGAVAGLAGAVLVSGVVGALEPRALATNLGFTGIIVAALARLNPLAVIPVAVFMGALNNSGTGLQTIRVPSSTVLMLQGLILVLAVSGTFLLANRVRLRRRPVQAEGVP